MGLHDIRPCPCGSGKPSQWLLDAKGIPVARVCDAECERKVRARYNPIIFTGYTQADMDERIEEDY
jgi:hypothetical protein